MRVFTIKSEEEIGQELRNEIHYSFGMEKHTDYVFKDREEGPYSATISLLDSAPVINLIIKESARFQEFHFVIDDLDLDQNSVEQYHIHAGEVKKKRKAIWEWDREE